MKKLLFLLALVAIPTGRILTQDSISTYDGKLFRGEIKYETPKGYKMVNLAPEHSERYGRSTFIARSSVVDVSDNGHQALLKKFGNVRINRFEGMHLTGPFYSHSQTGVAYVAEIYTSHDGRKQYHTLEVPVETIKSLKWSRDKAAKGAMFGAAVGSVIGALFGWASYDMAKSGYLFTPPEDPDAKLMQYLPKGILIGAGTGGLTGMIIGAIAGEKVEFDVNGDQMIWDFERQELPPPRINFN